MNIRQNPFPLMLASLMVLVATLACSTAALEAPQAVADDSQGEATSVPAPADEPNDNQDDGEPEPPITDLADLQSALEQVYVEVNPSVVSISISASEQGSELIDVGGGSGFVIDEQGHIVTNNHVVEQADGLRVAFSDGMVLTAGVIGRDPYSDLAVIKVEVPADYVLHPVEMGNSDDLQVGQFVIAIGSPFGLTNSMTLGIVSAIGRTLPANTGDGQAGGFTNPQIIQTDAAINPGNSGGPLIDISGQVIGVNAAIRSASGINSGIGFAIPVNTVKHIIPQLIENGAVDYPYLGIEAMNISLADLASDFDMPALRGVLIGTVVPGGPADQAGLRGGTEEVTFRGVPLLLGGDIITSINGVEVANFDELISYLISNTSPGDVITLNIIRDNATMEVPLTLGSRPAGVP
jgi:S1-C subfamily serine protease